jgi:cyclopropane-fatty-acyl-phospholipid synthase
MDAWINRYIFPNAVLPSIAALGTAMEDQLVVEDVHNIGPHYDMTLMAWLANFERAWPTLRGKYGDEFFRMWRYYLLTSAGSFRARYLQVYQLVMTIVGRKQPESIRS